MYDHALAYYQLTTSEQRSSAAFLKSSNKTDRPTAAVYAISCSAYKSGGFKERSTRKMVIKCVNYDRKQSILRLVYTFGSPIP